MSYSHVLFDLDGTLTDPQVGITKSVQYALAKFGITVYDLEHLTPFIGPPLQRSFQEFYGLSAADSLRAVEYYREYFSQNGIFENQLYNGIADLLQSLYACNVVLVVATSKPTMFAQQILHHFGLASYFTLVVGSNLDGTRSDKTEIIAHVLAQMQLDPANVVMIGDRKHDLIGARNCGIHSIGVEYGYGSPEELRNERPTHTVRFVQELRHLLLEQP